MLKIAAPPERLISNRLEVSDSKSGNSIGGMKITKKSKKLKDQKLSKSWKSTKSGKNLSKSENLLNFDTKNNGSSFLTTKARAAFNRL